MLKERSTNIVHKGLTTMQQSPGAGWGNFKENFSDLLERETPKRKHRRRTCNKSILRDISSLSQEIQVASSEEECELPYFGIGNFVTGERSSPVAVTPAHKTSIRYPSSESRIKSTPSGSPILRSQQKRAAPSSLIPLSPITPGLRFDHSIQNKSVFSVHLNDSSREHLNFDQTPLAMPLLDYSDEDIGHSDRDSSIELEGYSQATLDIDTIDTQKSENGMSDEERDGSMKENLNFFQLRKQSKTVSILETTGSRWIEGIKEKIDEKWRREAVEFAAKDDQDISYYDSGRKNKFVKGGLAERLGRILKKEDSKRSVFSQRKKTIQADEKCSLRLISAEKEGALHLLECKKADVENEYSPTFKNNVTIILPHEYAKKLNLTLGCRFTLHPPWYPVELNPMQPTVLLSAYFIQVEDEKQSIRVEDDGEHNVSPSNDYYENLLKSLEMHSSQDEGVSIVATVQRVFCSVCYNASKKWSLLCQDAYGTFFVVEIDSLLSNNESWLNLAESCEGQRIIFRDLLLGSRALRSQYPSLFSVIDSVWCGTGHGLLQVPDSESQSMFGENSQESIQLLPPGYCYFLQAKTMDSISMQCHPRGETCQTPGCTEGRRLMTSSLNRTKSSSSWTDLLYRSSLISPISEILNQTAQTRFSILCNFVLIRKAFICHEHPDAICSKHENKYQINVKDIKQNGGSESTLFLDLKPSCYLAEEIHILEGRNAVLKDVFLQNDTVIADSHSRIAILNCTCCAWSVICQNISF